MSNETEAVNDAEPKAITVRDAIFSLHRRVAELERVVDIQRQQLELLYTGLKSQKEAIVQLAGITEPEPAPPAPLGRPN